MWLQSQEHAFDDRSMVTSEFRCIIFRRANGASASSLPCCHACYLLCPLPHRTAQRNVKTAFARAQHLRHGINASEWFAQSPQDYSTARTSRYTDDADIALMAKLGFDNVRLSIDAAPLEKGPLGPDGLNADFIGRLDHAVDTMLANGMAVQIDIHPESDYKTKVRETSEGVERFVMLWRKLAAHYADRAIRRWFSSRS